MAADAGAPWSEQRFQLLQREESGIDFLRRVVGCGSLPAGGRGGPAGTAPEQVFAGLAEVGRFGGSGRRSVWGPESIRGEGESLREGDGLARRVRGRLNVHGGQRRTLCGAELVRRRSAGDARRL